MRSLRATSRARGFRGAVAAAAAGLLCALAPAVPAAAGAGHPAAAGTAGKSTARGASARRVYQTPAQAQAQAERTGKPVPVTGATTPSSTLTADPDGAFTVTESGVPVRALVDGTWKSLDADLVRNPGGTWSPSVSSTPLTLSGGGTGPLATMSDGPYSLALTAPMALPAPQVSGNTAAYRNALPGVTLIVTADPGGGFSEVFEIASAKAAANPALRSLAFTAKTRGLALRSAPNGAITATGRGGQVIFSAPPSRMWDSSIARGLKTMISKTGTRVSVATARPAASTAQGPGTGARTARIGVTVSGSRIALVPGRSLLSGKGVTWPEYIDPSWDSAGASASHWAYVSGDFPSQDYYDTTSPLQVGVEPGTGTLSYAFYSMPLPSQIKGTTINSATVYFPEIWSYSCTASPVGLYLTGGISPSTTYDSQPSWGAELGSDNVAYGWSSTGEVGGSSSCPYSGKDVAYNITSAIASDASGTLPSSLTFGLKAGDTTSSDGWKQFADPGFSAIPENATLTITYAAAPAAPALSTAPAADCPAGTTILGDGNVYLRAAVYDKDGGTLTVAYHAYAGTGTSHTIDSSSVSAGSGTTAQLELTASELEGAIRYGSSNVVTISWSATVSTGLSGVPSSTANCTFIFSNAIPGAPTLTDSKGNPGCNTLSYKVGTSATFTAAPAAGTVTTTEPVSYTYQLNGGNPVTVTASASATPAYSAPVTVTPTRATNVLDITAVGPGGNLGQTFPCIINAAAPGPATDQDMTGDGIPDLLTVGTGTTGTAPGLWLAAGQGSGGRFDGTVATTATDIAPNGPQDTGTPASWDGLQAITGQFDGPGFNDIEAYQPGTGNAYLLAGSGDGSAATSQDQNLTGVFKDEPTISTADCTGGSPSSAAYPQQLVNAYSTAGGSQPYPDQIGLFDDTTAGSQYLAYFADNGGINSFDGGTVLRLPYDLSNDSPDGTMDWASWTISTDSDTRSGTAYTDMWLRNQSTGALYLWELTGLGSQFQGTQTPSTSGGKLSFTCSHASATLTYTQTQISSDWDKGTPLAAFQATDVNGDPGLATVTTTGQVQSWQWNGTALTQANATGPAQALLTASHTYLLDKGAGGTAVTTAPDQPGAGVTAQNLTGNTGTTWKAGDPLFSPDVKFNGTSGYLSGATTAGDFSPASSYTISAWVDPSALGGTVFSQDGSSYSAITVSSTASGRWTVSVNTTPGGTSGSYTSGTGGTARAGVWADLTLTYDTAGGADLIKLYVNGSEALAFTDTTPPTATGKFLLGAGWSNGAASGFFSGQIAEAQVWDTLAVPVQPATSPSDFVPVTPVRIMDTRINPKTKSAIGPVTGPVAADSTVTLPIDGNTTAKLPASGITAAAVSITVTAQTAGGYLTAYPAGASLPVTSTVNFTSTVTFTSAGNVTNNAIVPVGPGGAIAIYNATAGTDQIIVDLTGYFTTSLTTADASTYTPLPSPARIMDTRPATQTGPVTGPVAAHSTTTLPISGISASGVTIPATGVTAVALNITAVVPSGSSGFLEAYPASSTVPLMTSLSFGGTTQAATVIIPVSSNGDIDIRNSSADAINLIGDLSGYFTTSTTGQHYHPLDSTRIIDTRQSAPLASNGTLTISNPASITADNPTLILNITATAGTADGDLQAYPSTASKPASSIVNYATGQTVPNLALVNTATGNAFTIDNQSAGTTDIVVDTNGYFQ